MLAKAGLKPGGESSLRGDWLPAVMLIGEGSCSLSGGMLEAGRPLGAF